MTSMFFWIFLIKAVTLHSGTEDFPMSRIGVFLSYLGTTPWEIHIFILTLHSEIRDVHQLNADVDYFFRAKKHSEIRDKQSYLVN